ncbi:hypothetical protein [Thauera sp. 28]|uniref:hypothetical protein n=1 Tax=Thauera sp. 28 TaxID=303682 RepID=UPI0002E93706|nr:hypothetical protein [Thauera sp. 28]
MLDIPALLANKSEAQLKAALEHLLAAHTLPVFGAAKQVEHEVAALRALKMLGALPDNADEYTLVTTLRITKAKARNLLYQDALRTLTSPQQIDDALRTLAALIQDLVPPADRKSVADRLQRQGIEGDDLRSLIPYFWANQGCGPYYDWKRARAPACSPCRRRRDRARARHSVRSQTEIVVTV